MKAEKLRGTDAAELQRQVQDAREQLFRFRFQMGMGQTEGLKKYRSLKKDRARMLTVLREKNAPEPVGETPAVSRISAAQGKSAKGKAASSKGSKGKTK